MLIFREENNKNTVLFFLYVSIHNGYSHLLTFKTAGMR